MDIKDILKFIETKASPEELDIIKLACHQNRKKTYTFYYLPNAVNHNYPNEDGSPRIGKVGQTCNVIEHRIFNNSKELDITGWQILGTHYGTLKEALAIEKKFQIEYNCLDGSSVRKKSCQYCSREFASNTIWSHEKSCKENPNMVPSNLFGGGRRVYTKANCKFCSREISKLNLKRHEVSCLKNQQKSADALVKKIKCQYCSREIVKFNIQRHERSCKENPEKSAGYSFKKVECRYCSREIAAMNIKRHEVSCLKNQ
jgi:hypothetical protein